MADIFAGGHLRYLNGAWRDDNGDPVEIELVVHAHWIEDDHACCRNCSACGFEVDDDAATYLYGDYLIKPKRCPECGAHMDERGVEEDERISHTDREDRSEKG